MTFISFQNIIKIMAKYWDKFLIDGVSYTLALSAITVSCGAIFAVILAWMKMADIRPVKLLLGCFGLDCEFMDRGKLGKLFQVRPLRLISTAYIEIIRGTPSCCSFTSSTLLCPCWCPFSTSRSLPALP